MSDSQNRIELRYFLISILPSLLITGCGIYLLGIFDSVTIKELALAIINIALTFSLTFAAFSLTALALLQLLQDKSWYIKVKESSHFKKFLKRFLLSIQYTIICFVISLISRFLVEIGKDIVTKSIALSILFFILFIIIWIWYCIRDFIILFKE